MNKNLIVLLVVTAVLILATGCINIGSYDVGPTQTETQAVEQGSAETLTAEINMGAGQLEIDGGAAELVEAEFTYNIETWKPELAYDVRGDNGRLSINQPDSGEINGIPTNNIEYNWDIRFNDNVPTDLTINLGAGEGLLDLNGLHLTNLKVEVGAGQTEIDLSGDWPESFDVNVSGGVGATEIVLPNNVGVRVKPTTGIGNLEVYGLVRNGDVYTNDLYGQADVELDINVSSGIGEITLRIAE
ncbi:MAG: toast rack family protein [Chloroflexota bacterium]